MGGHNILGKGVRGLSDSKKLPIRVQMTVYVEPGVKTAMKLVAAKNHTSISDIVENLCRRYLKGFPFIRELVEGKE